MDPGQNNFGSSQTNYVVKRANDKAGVAQQAISYQATGVKSKFRGGKFTQELSGTWLQTPAKNAVAAADTGRKTDPVTGTTPISSINNAQDPERGGTSVLLAGASVYNNNNVQNLTTSVADIGSSSTPNSIASINNATLIPAAAPTQDPALTITPAVAAPPVLPRNGLGSRAYDLEFANSSDTVGSSTPSQGIVNDDQGKPR